MSQKAVEQIIGRLVTDDCFREKAKHDLASLCVEEGYDLTEAECRIIASLELDWLAQASEPWLDDRIKRFAPKRNTC